MKGIIFNLLEDVLTRHLSEDAWDDVVEGSGREGAYTCLGNYSDQEFGDLLNEASKHTNLGRPDLLRWFGRHSMPMLASRYPKFFREHTRVKPFLLTLNDVIHSEVRKLYPGADVPNFEFEQLTNSEGKETLIIHYSSQRRLCHLAEGFILGAADHFTEPVAISQDVCMHEGDDACVIRCTFGDARD